MSYTIHARHASRQATSFADLYASSTRKEWFHKFNEPPMVVGRFVVDSVSRGTLTRWENGIHALCRDLTGGVYKVAIRLSKLFNSRARGWAWPSRRYLADLCGVSIATVARALKLLKDKGLLHVDSGQKMWRPSRYFPLFGFRSCITGDTPHLPKAKHKEKNAEDRPLGGDPGGGRPDQDAIYLRELRRQQVIAELRSIIDRPKPAG